jgi:pimeloyl-ACP methyl ester carboxylesterase
MQYIQQDGLSFNYSDSGGSATPFIFQHGLGADLTQPVALVKADKRFRVISFDFRAHGNTHPVGPVEKIGIAAFADDVRAILDNLKIQRAIIGGISMGAAVSLNFALRFPERVIGLVLSRPAWLDAPNPWNVKMFTLITKLIAAHGPIKGQQLFKQTLEYAQTLQQWPDVAASFAAQFERPGIEDTGFKLERIIHDTPSLDRREWSRIEVPTLVIGNREDPIHPYDYAVHTAELIPGAEFREVTSKAIDLDRHNADVQRVVGEFLAARFS